MQLWNRLKKKIKRFSDVAVGALVFTFQKMELLPSVLIGTL